MQNGKSDRGPKNPNFFSVMVPVDFSTFSLQALRTARTFMGQKPSHLFVLHVIDSDFVNRCVRNSLGTEDHIKKTLSIAAKARLKDLLQREGIDDAERLVCMGTPFLEINKKAVQYDVNMVVMGSRGNSGEMKNIFFGGTTERVLRFIKRPVLCVPLDEV